MNKVKLGYSKIIPFKGFYAINLFGVLIRREKYRNRPIGAITLNHESIHTAQAEDFLPNPTNKTWKRILGFIPFYILYGIEWLWKGVYSLFTKDKEKIYRSLSFEQEAYEHEGQLKYLKNRKRWAWTKYIFKFVNHD